MLEDDDPRSGRDNGRAEQGRHRDAARSTGRGVRGRDSSRPHSIEQIRPEGRLPPHVMFSSGHLEADPLGVSRFTNGRTTSASALRKPLAVLASALGMLVRQLELTRRRVGVCIAGPWPGSYIGGIALKDSVSAQAGLRAEYSTRHSRRLAGPAHGRKPRTGLLRARMVHRSRCHRVDLAVDLAFPRRIDRHIPREAVQVFGS